VRGRDSRSTPPNGISDDYNHYPILLTHCVRSVESSNNPWQPATSAQFNNISVLIQLWVDIKICRKGSGSVPPFRAEANQLPVSTSLHVDSIQIVTPKRVRSHQAYFH
jgi:hypothetical protein